MVASQMKVSELNVFKRAVQDRPLTALSLKPHAMRGKLFPITSDNFISWMNNE